MPDKDMTEKNFIAYNNVFADIVNLFFAMSGIKRRVNPNDLKDLRSRSIYKFGDKLHEQERDVVKLWEIEGIAICIVGLENQTDIDPNMTLRVFGYEGADYRGQLNNKNKSVHFVLTIVLYYGTEKRWTAPKNLFERLNVPEEFRPFVNDCHVNVIELAWLTDKQEKLLSGEFRAVVNYLKQTRRHEHYDVPEDIEVEHVDALLKLLHAMTGDYRFESILKDLPKGEYSMQKVKSLLESGENKLRSEEQKKAKVAVRKARTEERAKSFARVNRITKRLLERGMSPEEIAEIIE